MGLLARRFSPLRNLRLMLVCTDLAGRKGSYLGWAGPRAAMMCDGTLPDAGALPGFVPESSRWAGGSAPAGGGRTVTLRCSLNFAVVAS